MAADHYIGPERRVAHRRQLADRRRAIRFEPTKEPRRSGRDRRSHDTGIWSGREKF